MNDLQAPQCRCRWSPSTGSFIEAFLQQVRTLGRRHLGGVGQSPRRSPARHSV